MLVWTARLAGQESHSHHELPFWGILAGIATGVMKSAQLQTFALTSKSRVAFMGCSHLEDWPLRPGSFDADSFSLARNLLNLSTVPGLVAAALSKCQPPALSPWCNFQSFAHVFGATPVITSVSCQSSDFYTLHITPQALNPLSGADSSASKSDYHHGRHDDGSRNTMA